MDTLPNDIKRVVALELSPPDLIKFCLTNKNTNNAICKSNDFWRQKLMIDYPQVFDYYVRNKMIIKNPKNLYIRKFTEVYRMIENFVDEEFVFGKYLTDKHEKLMEVYKQHPEMKDDLKKRIYLTYNEILKKFSGEYYLKSIVEYKIPILNRINLKYRLSYFDSLEFSENLDKLLLKLLNKDQMYNIKR
jgi:hypothetical protein